MKRRTLSLDDEADRILTQRKREVGKFSLAARQLLREADGNQQTLRNSLRGAINSIAMNARLVRSGIHLPGVLAFVDEIERVAGSMEKMLARSDGSDAERDRGAGRA